MVGDDCALCGRPTGEHDRHLRFAQPDPVLRADGISPSDIWMTSQDANSSVMMQVPGVGAFVRALLPIKLTDDHRVTYGVWIAIDPAQLRHVFDVWWEPACRDLALEGYLANSVEPWGLLGAPVSLRTLDPEQTPYCVKSSDDRFNSVLTDEWDHELVLSALADGASPPADRLARPVCGIDEC